MALSISSSLQEPALRAQIAHHVLLAAGSPSGATAQAYVRRERLGGINGSIKLVVEVRYRWKAPARWDLPLMDWMSVNDIRDQIRVFIAEIAPQVRRYVFISPPPLPAAA